MSLIISLSWATLSWDPWLWEQILDFETLERNEGLPHWYKIQIDSTSALIANTDEISRLDRKFLKHAIPQGTIFYSKNKICLLEMLIVQWFWL